MQEDPRQDEGQEQHVQDQCPALEILMVRMPMRLKPPVSHMSSPLS